MAINVRWLICGGTACVALTAALSAFSQQDDTVKAEKAGRPKLTLKADPTVGFSPSRVTLTAELVGGANDHPDFYCPAIEWDWGDGTRSEFASDCKPYERGKSEITRRFSVVHIFREGGFSIKFRLKRQNQVIAAANAKVAIN